MRSNLNIYIGRPAHPPMHAWRASDFEAELMPLTAAEPLRASESGVQASRSIEQLSIGVIGLGYVGLPLATEFGRRYATIGFDLDARRIGELRQGKDRTREVSEDALRGSHWLSFADDAEALRGWKHCNGKLRSQAAAASDAHALLPMTRRFIYLDDGDSVHLSHSAARIYSADGSLRNCAERQAVDA